LPACSSFWKQCRRQGWDDAAADAAGEIRRSLERSGKPIGMADCLIAGIVTSNGGTLMTRNRRHFERVPGIRLS